MYVCCTPTVLMLPLVLTHPLTGRVLLAASAVVALHVVDRAVAYAVAT